MILLGNDFIGNTGGGGGGGTLVSCEIAGVSGSEIDVVDSIEGTTIDNGDDMGMECSSDEIDILLPLSAEDES